MAYILRGNQRLIRVAFWFDRPLEYTGGLNYIKNLLYAISLVNRGRIDPYIFLTPAVSQKDMEGFSSLATVVLTPMLKRKTMWWFLDRLLVKSIGSHLLVKRELRKHGIQVISHAACVSGLGAPFRVISWTPDFQFLHLPKFFPGLNVNDEKRRLRKFISQADATILSSHAAYKDFCEIATENSVARAHVLPFVSQPDTRLSVDDDAASKEAIERKYGFRGKYFYLPNQFWVHKNHWLVFKAVAFLKARGTEVLVVCTGNMNDYRIRNSEYIDALREFIKTESLERHLLILGLIPYEDVLFLMRNCLAVINPSRFEGWSSTVEEAKSIGKKVLLSNIAVHMEQNPKGGRYFDPDNVAELCAIMQEIWDGPESRDTPSQCEAKMLLHERTLAYGEGYVRLVEQIQSGVRNTEP
jgi:glycosyltransferase involved in cell wall biosynthesis